jgi:transcriptional regulator with XRE-family HTH domain
VPIRARRTVDSLYDNYQSVIHLTPFLSIVKYQLVRRLPDERKGETMGLGEKIQELLDARNMSRKELAEASGLTEAAISRYITGTRAPKSISLSAIAKALDVTSDELLGNINDTKDEVDDAIRLVARNAGSVTKEQKKYLINALIGD